ncbi:hypothetical protein KCP77_00140 [Salmonella enterica subsp. enterica]|nr:hypothetical protein KCP77_00140 [Salmonella enterica subsp. enterica]
MHRVNTSIIACLPCYTKAGFQRFAADIPLQSLLKFETIIVIDGVSVLVRRNNP